MNRKAFTLIELLVVIAIIAILAAILFPVFAQAREKARQTTCLSNEKQLALGVVQYVQDYDEAFPEGGPDGTGAGWACQVYPYVKSKAVFVCPDDPTPGDVCSYGYNQNLTAWNNDPNNAANGGIPYGQIDGKLNSPASTVVLAEVTGNTWNTTSSAPSYDISCGDYASWGCDIGPDSQGDNEGKSPAGIGWGGVSDPGGAGSYWWTNDPPGYPNGTLEWATGYLPGSENLNYPGSTPYMFTQSGRHTGGANYVMADGHVKWFMPDMVCAGENNPSPTDCGAFVDGTDWPPYAAGSGCSDYRATWSIE